MAWSEDITGELPAPRDDEPQHLRKDIADELSDHLHCALNRELHFTQDEQQAKQNVLSRFRNVNRIARQLWFCLLFVLRDMQFSVERALQVIRQFVGDILSQMFRLIIPRCD